ncbi:DUF4148 domain-containing protein [Burkholderia gladioli]|uniref:DUF4148 domain-containing protein n=1 Tax=Burkholderia gladioli TaxID=28095 RepID=UPI001FC85198|nr:DUF4148 domain-containing protein [Burkholderia gladioli]
MTEISCSDHARAAARGQNQAIDTEPETRGMKSALRLSLGMGIALAGLCLGEQATAQAKTRAEVRQELLQARHDGYLPNRRTNFPPDASMVARSRQLHRLTIHRGESSPRFDEHDTRDPAARPAQ